MIKSVSLGRMFFVIACAMIHLSLSARAWAQDPPRFQPPRPPPMDQDFEDPAEDELENSDAPSRAQAIPPPSTGVPISPPPPVTEFRPQQPPPTGTIDSAKLKFKVVEGQFYEKGQKRGRTPQGSRSR